MDKKQTCKDLWEEEMRDDVKSIYNGWRRNEEGYLLSFDYVAPRTFEGQREGYWRMQVSWGGPSSEFRFFGSNPEVVPHRVEYWYMDWFDGHGDEMPEGEEDKIMQVFNDFKDMGSVEHEFNQAMKDYKDEDQ